MNVDVPKSHQIGATSWTRPDQIIALIPYVKFDMKSQTIIESVVIFRVRQCHGRGTSRRAQARNAPMGISRCIMKEIECLILGSPCVILQDLASGIVPTDAYACGLGNKGWES